MSATTWRENCPHVVECGSEEECNALSADAAATSSNQTATEQPTMTKKTKPEEQLNAERIATERAARFAHYARAAADLRQLGAFPAVEQLYSACVAELTVLARELHDARLAKLSEVKP